MAGYTHKRQRQAGFTLIELNCALFIIMFGLFGMMQMYRVCIDKTMVNQEDILALRILENELEGLRALPFDALKIGEAQAFQRDIPKVYDLVNATGKTRISAHPEGNGRLKEITVVLRWTGENGRTRQKSLSTLLARKEALP